MANMTFLLSIPELHPSDFDSIHPGLVQAQAHMIGAIGYAEEMAVIIRDEILPQIGASVNNEQAALFSFPYDISNINNSFNDTVDIDTNQPRFFSPIEMIDLCKGTTIDISD
ncbi:uncharacterized protein LOC141857573 [Brevipalpus obovatus]|uniref:uncharacterized protein LOC141857573 n=1 Tax=Brevipalpus obovatus TaxID=246614 RepID=UPI003D9F8340